MNRGEARAGRITQAAMAREQQEVALRKPGGGAARRVRRGKGAEGYRYGILAVFLRDYAHEKS